MKVRIVDPDALASANPRNIRLYLLAHGWQRSDNQSRDIWALSLDGDEEYEVLVPSTNFADFAQQVGILLYTLAAVEDRSELDILRDLSTLSFDVQHIRKHQSGPLGTIRIGEAVRSYQAARDLVSAAATSVELADPVLPRSSDRPQVVKHLLREVLTGPPEAGSFVMSVWVPVPPARQVGLDDVLVDDPAGDPFQRRVTLRLHEAIAAVGAAARQVDKGTDLAQAFVGRESAGVNADLCKAIADLVGGRSEPLEFRYSWALDRPVSGLSSVARIGAPSIEVLVSAAKLLRALHRQEGVRLQGLITAARVRPQGGDVVVKGSLGDLTTRSELTVTIRFGSEEYSRALLAHHDGAPIAVVGNLEPRAGRPVMTPTEPFIRLGDQGGR